MKYVHDINCAIDHHSQQGRAFLFCRWDLQSASQSGRSAGSPLQWKHFIAFTTHHCCMYIPFSYKLREQAGHIFLLCSKSLIFTKALCISGEGKSHLIPSLQNQPKVSISKYQLKIAVLIWPLDSSCVASSRLDCS